jgi:hypothetical protein
MNKGVEILLARMETHPEEFEVDGRWVGLFNEYKKYMEPEEQTAVMEKLRQVKMGKFETLVVKHLLREEREEEPLQRDMFGNSGSPYASKEDEIGHLKRILMDKLAKVDR